MRDLIVVGAGPAGLTAALYAARAGLSVLLLEKSLVGGQLSLSSLIENYPGFPSAIGGPELAMAMEAQAVRAGAELRYEAAESIDCAGRRVRLADGWEAAGSLILSLGVSPKRLGVPGEAKFLGRGISFCATCDGALYKGRPVAVIGGGNSAAEEALYLAGLGCRVLLIHRRDALRAEEAVTRRVLASPAIVPLWNSAVTAFEGDSALVAVRVNGDAVHSVDAAFVSIGRQPDTALVSGQLALDGFGFIRTDEDCATNIPGVYAAGDVRSKRLRQVTTAVGDGALAARAALQYLGEGVS